MRVSVGDKTSIQYGHQASRSGVKGEYRQNTKTPKMPAGPIELVTYLNYYHIQYSTLAPQITPRYPNFDITRYSDGNCIWRTMKNCSLTNRIVASLLYMMRNGSQCQSSFDIFYAHDVFSCLLGSGNIRFQQRHLHYQRTTSCQTAVERHNTGADKCRGTHHNNMVWHVNPLLSIFPF